MQGSPGSSNASCGRLLCAHYHFSSNDRMMVCAACVNVVVSQAGRCLLAIILSSRRLVQSGDTTIKPAGGGPLHLQDWLNLLDCQRRGDDARHLQTVRRLERWYRMRAGFQVVEVPHNSPVPGLLDVCPSRLVRSELHSEERHRCRGLRPANRYAEPDSADFGACGHRWCLAAVRRSQTSTGAFGRKRYTKPRSVAFGRHVIPSVAVTAYNSQLLFATYGKVAKVMPSTGCRDLLCGEG